MNNNFFKVERDENNSIKEVDLEIQGLVNKMNKIHMQIINARIKRILLKKNIELDALEQEIIAVEILSSFKDVTIMSYNDDEFYNMVLLFIEKLNRLLHSVE